jgi:hypothetical protein
VLALRSWFAEKGLSFHSVLCSNIMGPQYKYKAYLVNILKKLGFGSIANVPAFILDVYKKQQMHATVCGRDAHKRKVTYILEKVNRNFFFPFFFL